MNRNNKLEDSLNKIFSSSGYKMVDVSSKEVTHRKALAVGEIILSSEVIACLLYTSPSPRDATLSRMPSSA